MFVSTITFIQKDLSNDSRQQGTFGGSSINLYPIPFNYKSGQSWRPAFGILLEIQLPKPEDASYNLTDFTGHD